MIWRRLAEVLLRRPLDPSTDERSIQAKRLTLLDRELKATNSELRRDRIRAQSLLAEQRFPKGG